MGSIMTYDVIIIGAGLVGLGVASALQESQPELKVLVIDRMPAPFIKVAITAMLFIRGFTIHQEA